MKRYYVAYGSNLNVQQMRWRCPGARIIGTSELKDYRLLFKGSKTGSYLTIEPEAGCTVPVAVWEVTDQDELALDRYEGFPSFYYKKELVLDVKGICTGKLRRRTAAKQLSRRTEKAQGSLLMHERAQPPHDIAAQGLIVEKQIRAMKP